MALFRRLWNVFRPSRLERDIADELQFHREMSRRRAEERGFSAHDSEQEASRRFGSRGVAEEGMRDARVIPWLASSMADLRHGVSLLKRDAGVSSLIVLALALGIGGSSAIFTLVKAAFLDPLPYKEAERLVTIVENNGWGASDSEYRAIRDRSRTLEQVAIVEHRDMQLFGPDGPARVYAAHVSASFFPLLETTAALGRTFVEEENQTGGPSRVLLTDNFGGPVSEPISMSLAGRSGLTGRRRGSSAFCLLDFTSTTRR